MEFWPGDLVLHYGATTIPINMNGEAPILERWLAASPSTIADDLAGRIAEAQNAHSRSTRPETPMAIDPIEAHAIHEALEEHRDDLEGHDGLVNLWNTLGTVDS